MSIESVIEQYKIISNEYEKQRVFVENLIQQIVLDSRPVVADYLFKNGNEKISIGVLEVRQLILLYSASSIQFFNIDNKNDAIVGVTLPHNNKPRKVLLNIPIQLFSEQEVFNKALLKEVEENVKEQIAEETYAAMADDFNREASARRPSRRARISSLHAEA